MISSTCAVPNIPRLNAPSSKLGDDSDVWEKVIDNQVLYLYLSGGFPDLAPYGLYDVVMGIRSLLQEYAQGSFDPASFQQLLQSPKFVQDLQCLQTIIYEIKGQDPNPPADFIDELQTVIDELGPKTDIKSKDGLETFISAMQGYVMADCRKYTDSIYNELSQYYQKYPEILTTEINGKFVTYPMDYYIFSGWLQFDSCAFDPNYTDWIKAGKPINPPPQAYFED